MCFMAGLPPETQKNSIIYGNRVYSRRKNRDKENHKTDPFHVEPLTSKHLLRHPHIYGGYREKTLDISG